MNLPFTQEQFFALFAEYNRAVWPAQLVLVCLAIAMAAGVLTNPARAGRLVSYGLAVLWAWTAVAYHLALFREINPATVVTSALGKPSAR